MKRQDEEEVCYLMGSGNDVKDGYLSKEYSKKLCDNVTTFLFEDLLLLWFSILPEKMIWVCMISMICLSFLSSPFISSNKLRVWKKNWKSAI